MLVVALAATAAGGFLATRSHQGVSLVPPAPAPPDYREAVVTGHPLVLDPVLAHGDPASRDLARLLDRALLRLDGRAVPVPDLASTWGVSGDGLLYRFQLPVGIQWSDGSPVRPDDVVATVHLVQRADFPDAALAAAWRGVAAAPDGPSAVTLTLPMPRASFAATVADLPVLPAATAVRATADLVAAAPREAPPGSGPMVVRSVDAAAVHLEQNPRATVHPHLGTVELRLEPDFGRAADDLRAGAVDALEAVTPAERAIVAGLTGISLHESVSFRFVDLLFDTRQPGLDDVAVRRALATAVDRGKLVDGPLEGAARPQTAAIPVGIAWVGSTAAELPDPALAARALDAAGWSVDPRTGVRARNGHTLSFTLTVTDAPPLTGVAESLARQLREVGVALTVASVRAADFTARVLSGRPFQTALAEWDNGPDPDIAVYWRSNATPPAGDNVSALAPDLFLDRALDGLAVERDPQLRADAATRVEQRLAGTVPAVFLYAPTTTFATGPRIAGVTVPASGTAASRYDTVADWRRA